MPRKLTYPEAVAALDQHGFPVTESTLRHWVSARKVAFLKFGRRVLFDEEDLLNSLPVTRVEPRGRHERKRSI